MLLPLHGVLSPLWPCFCFILPSLPPAAARPRLVLSPADGAPAVQAKASLQKSTGMFSLFSARPENTLGSIQRHSIAVFSSKHYLYMKNKKNMEMSLWMAELFFFLITSLLFDTELFSLSFAYVFLFWWTLIYWTHIYCLLSDWLYFILLKACQKITVGSFYYQADRHCTSNK